MLGTLLSLHVMSGNRVGNYSAGNQGIGDIVLFPPLRGRSRQECPLGPENSATQVVPGTPHGEVFAD